MKVFWELSYTVQFLLQHAKTFWTFAYRLNFKLNKTTLYDLC